MKGPRRDKTKRRRWKQDCSLPRGTRVVNLRAFRLAERLFWFSVSQGGELGFPELYDVALGWVNARTAGRGHGPGCA